MMLATQPRKTQPKTPLRLILVYWALIASVHAGEVNDTWQWPVSEPAAVDLNEQPLNRAHRKIIQGHYLQVDSMLVVRHGQLVFEKYYNNGKRISPHRLASAGKSILSALVGISIDKNQIRSVDDKLYDYFRGLYPSYQHWDERKANITLHHLLTMRAGWDCFIMRPETRCGRLMYQDKTPLEATKWLLDRPMKSAPGTVMRYTDAIPNILQSVVNLAGGSLAAINYQDDLFKPIGVVTESPLC